MLPSRAARSHSDVVVLVLGAVVAGLVVGVGSGRWWALVGIVPLASLVVAEGELEGHLNSWVAFVASVAYAAGVAAGIAIRRAGSR